MRSLLDIIIKIKKEGGADKETIASLYKLKAAFVDAAAVAGTLVAAGFAIKKVFDATVGTMVAYADQVRAIQQSTGMSAEESSKLIQVLDDMKVSYESLQKVIQKNGDEFDYSVEGLAAMSDQYNNLSSAQERAEFMQKRFGKSWVEFVETMEQGGDKIRAAGDDINAGLILDQESIDSAREYQVQIDNLTDSWEALKVSAGANALMPTVDLLKKINLEIEEGNGKIWQADKAWRGLLGPIGQVWNLLDLMGNKTNDDVFTAYGNRANAMQAYLSKEREALIAAADAREAHGDALMNNTAAAGTNTTALDENAQALEAQNAVMEGVLKNALWLTDNQEKYNEDLASLQTMRDAELVTLDELTKKYGATSGKLDEQKIKVGELDQKIQDLKATQKEQTDQWVLSLMEQQGASVEMQIAYAEAAGLINENSMATVLAIDSVNQQLKDGKIDAQQYRDMVAKLIARIQALDGLEAYADIYVTEHGGLSSRNFHDAINIAAQTNPDRTYTLGTGRASGGPVRKGMSYVVGERGRELFVPNEAGTIIPNHNLGNMGGSSMTVNITYAPMFSTANKQELLQNITPILNEWQQRRLTS